MYKTENFVKKTHNLGLNLVLSEVQSCYAKGRLWEVCHQRNFTGMAVHAIGLVILRWSGALLNPSLKSALRLTK